MSNANSSVGLSELQKDLLIFLLAALIVSALLIFISWRVWKRCCGKELKELRAQRELGNEDDWPSIRSSTMTPRDGRRGSRSSREQLFERENFQQRVRPTAPSFNSFTGPGNAISMETVSSSAAGSSGPLLEANDASLPSYDTVMRQHPG